MRAVRRGGSSVGCRHREVVQTALNRIATSKRRVVLHARFRKRGTSGHARGLVRPFGFACRNGDVTETVARHTAGAVTRRTSVWAMERCIGHGSTSMIRAATERITGHIRGGSRRERSSGAYAALLVCILRIRIFAIRRDCLAVCLDRTRHHARAGRAGRTGRAGRAGLAGARAGRAGRTVGIVRAAAKGKSRRSNCQEAYEKNIRFGHLWSISQ